MDKNHDEKDFGKMFDWHLIKRLNKYTKPLYWILAISLVAVLLSSVADLMRPYLMKVVVDDYLTGYKNEMMVSDTSFDNDKEVKFNDQYYLRTKYEPKANNSLLASKQLLKHGDDFLLIDGFTDFKISSEDYDLETHGTTFTLTIKAKATSKFQPDKMTYQGQFISEANYKLFREQDIAGIYWIAFLLVMTLLLALVFSYVQAISLSYVGQKVVHSMRKEMFAHLQHSSLSYYEKNPIGRLVTRITNDMNNVSEMYTNVIITFVKDTVILVGTMTIMVFMDWRLSLLCFSTIPIVLFVSFVFRRQVRSIQRTIKIKIAQINSTLSENITGMKIIQLFNQEKHMFKIFDKTNKEHLNAWLKEVNIFAIFRPSMNLIYSITLGILIYFGGNSTLNGAVELGVMIAFITYIQNYFRPIFDLSEKFNIMQAAMASLERIFYIIDHDEMISNDGPLQLQGPFQGRIEFENVEFAYKPNEPIIRGINFEIKPGETVAIVGATGSGKTTITSLIGRFYDIQAGQIRIDGHPIKSMDLQYLRQQISVVLQDVFLFAGSIRDNITLREDMTDEKVKYVADFVNASHFIDKLDQGYDHILTEKGSTLSAGQRQLLSFARALAFDPSILILDEATSNIDTETELLIQDAITKLIKDRTTIIIAHRLSTIQHADKIIVMHKGQICEMGTHQELLANTGRYYDLYRLQYQEAHSHTS